MKALQRDFQREIQNSKSRFFSILILVALAVAFLSGLKSTAPDMKRTCDAYLDQQNFMDIQVLSTLGLTQEDLEVLLAQEGVSGGEGAYVIDAFAKAAELDLVAKVYSLPHNLNLLTVEKGRLPQQDHECVVDRNLLSSLNVSVGDDLTLQAGGSDSDNLRQTQFTIVGAVTSPYYISVERGNSTLGTGRVAAYVYIPEGAFDMDVYTAVYLTVEGAQDSIAFSPEYDQLVDGVIDTLEPLGDQRAQLRHDSVVGDATEQLDEAQQKLDDAKADAQQELSDGWSKLTDARRELDDGWRKLEDARNTLAVETVDAQQKIDDGKADLTDAQIQLDEGEQEYAVHYLDYLDGEQDYQDGIKAYEDGLAEYAKNEKKLQDAAASLSAGDTALSQAAQQLNQQQALFNTLMDSVLSAVNAGLVQQGQEPFSDYAVLLEAMTADSEGTGICMAVDTALSGLYAASALDSASILGLLQADPADITAGTALAMALPQVNAGLTAAGAPALEDVSALAAAMGAELSEGVPGPVCNAVDSALTATHTGLTQADGTSINTAYLLSAKQQLDDGWKAYYAGASSLSAGYHQYYDGKRQLREAKQQLEDAKKELEDARVSLDDAQIQLGDARKELDDGWAELQDGLSEIADGEQELAQQTADAQLEITDAVTELRSGEVEYNDGLTDYYAGKLKAEQKISDAESELGDARRELAELDECTWYLLSRDSNPGYLGYGQDADRMGNLASVFPVLFFLVAALVCLTTMTRMVEEERTQIGCLKALGYTRWQISRKYLGYGLLPSLIGSILGLGLGYTLFPKMIFTAYQIMYQLPDIQLRQYTDISVLSMAAAVACTTVSSLAACLATLSDTPANLMRPRTPKPGKRVFLEYIRPLWRRMSFHRKVTARNLFRYQKRFWMTVIGIGGCTALIIAGFGIRSSLLMTMNKQFDELYHYTAQVALSSSVLDSERENIERHIQETPDITQTLPCRLATFTAESDAYTISAYLEAADPTAIGTFVDLRDARSGMPLTIPDDGVIIDQKLSELLQVSVGDSFVLDGDSRVTVTVAAITEHYLSHFVYFSPTYYQQIFGEPCQNNAWLMTFSDDSPETCDRIFSGLLDLNGVASTTRMLDTRDTYLHSMERIDFVVVIVILCAAALAMVVLYNLSNINITERRRELATIKVLGFYDREVSAYVNRENVVLTGVGIGLGILFGHYLHVWLVKSVEIDLMMFGRTTDPRAYLWAGLLTAGFSVLVNLAASRRMRSIDMVESLKSAE